MSVFVKINLIFVKVLMTSAKVKRTNKNQIDKSSLFINRKKCNYIDDIIITIQKSFTHYTKSSVLVTEDHIVEEG